MALPEDYAQSAGNTQDTRGLTPEMIANKWQPGYCPNPAGRPKGSRNRQTIVLEALEAPDKETGLPNVDVATLAVVAKAKAGDVAAFKEVMDSGYGKTPDKQELTGADGGALQAIVRKVIDPKVIES